MANTTSLMGETEDKGDKDEYLSSFSSPSPPFFVSPVTFHLFPDFIINRIDLFTKILLPMDVIDFCKWLFTQGIKQRIPLAIFITLCLNLCVAQVVYAAGGGVLERRSAWAIGILGCIIFAVVIYLFYVIFQPEKF
jgi:K+-transporting ATPase KdpF subunit